MCVCVCVCILHLAGTYGRTAVAELSDDVLEHATRAKVQNTPGELSVYTFSG